jgi:hypothetical protein
MKKLIYVLIIAAMVFAVPVGIAGAQTKNTAFQIQNLSGSVANVSIAYYDSAGNEVVAARESTTIPANGSIMRPQSVNVNLPSGFNGSVVISADQPVAAIVNEDAVVGALHYQGAYNGGSSGMAIAYLPAAMKAYYNYGTEISVQNAGSSSITGTVKFFDGAGSEVVAARQNLGPLAAGAAARFNQGSNANLANGFAGSAVVEATGPVVTVVNQDNAIAKMEQTYNGFGAGATTLYLPVTMYHYYGFDTAFQIQNIGGSATDIVATFSDGKVITKTNIAPKAAAMFVQASEGHAASFLGSAKVTGTQNLVGIVNQQNATTGKASSYNAFTAASTTFVLPAVMKSFYGFNSAFQCQNVTTSNTTINVTYSDGVLASKPALAGQSALFVQSSEAHASWSGAATVTAGQNIVCIVNEEGPNGIGDNAMSYNGIAQ